jgi:general secretion pathway protein A
MYNAYWGFERSPFGGAIDPDQFYESPAHEEALARLAYISDERRQGAVVLGQAGVGKTLAVEVFLRRAQRPGREIAVARCPAFTGRELFFDLAQECGLAPAPEAGEAELWRLFRDHVAANRLADIDTVLLVDQAHLLAADLAGLRSLHLLFNLDTTPGARLTVILVGRPELLQSAAHEIVEWADLGVTIEPLSEAHTAQYIQHRTQTAGVKEPIFDRDAIIAIHELSHGIPRRINRICDMALLAASSEELHQVGEKVVRSVFAELSPEAAVEQVSTAICA